MAAWLQRWALYLLAGALALALAWGAAQTVRLAGEEAAHAKTIADFHGERTRAADATTAAVAAARAEEQRRHARLLDLLADAQAARDIAAADAVAAAGAADGLRQRAERLAARACPAAGDSAAPGSRPADRLAGAIADLAEEGRQLAARADRAIIAGRICERAYGALTP